MKAALDPVLAIARTIETLEREEERASLSGDRQSARRFDQELTQLDIQLELAAPTSRTGAAFLLRKAACCAEVGDGCPFPDLVEEIAGRVESGRVELIDLRRLRSAAANFAESENIAAADYLDNALAYLARPRLV